MNISLTLHTEKRMLKEEQDRVWSLIWDAENTSEGRYKYSLADYLNAKKVYKEAEERLSEIHEEEYPANLQNINYSNNA